MLHHSYIDFEYNSLIKVCRTSFLKGKNNIAIFSEGYVAKIILLLRDSEKGLHWENFSEEVRQKTPHQ